MKAHVMPVWEPKPYQDKGVKWLSSRPGAALFWPPGLGKTTTVFRAFQSLRDRKLAKRMLVVAPLRVCIGVWRQEQSAWSGFEDFTIGFAHGKDKEDTLIDESYDVVLLNYEGLLWAVPYLAEGMFDVLCLDELTRMKHVNTRRFKLFKHILPMFKFRWGLTGSPAPNGLLDLFAQIYVLDGGQRLGYGITRFRQTYFHQLPFDAWTWYPNSNTPKRIAHQLKDLANYVAEEDWNKLPPLIDVEIPINLPPEAYKQYKFLENEFILKLEEGVVTAANAGILSLKMRQAASGQIYGEDRQVLTLHEAKLDALEDLVEELAGSPLIVAVGFLHEVDAIRKRLGANIPYIGGGQSARDMEKTLKAWGLGWIPVLLAHPTSVAHGLNLQAGGNSVCWFSLTFNQEEYYQLIRRVYRTGQKNKVFVYYLLANKTIDGHVYKTLLKKGITQQQFLNSLKSAYGK